MVLTPRIPRTERITFRARPSEVRRLEAAAQLAEVTVSDVIREGALAMANQVLRSGADDDVPTEPEGS